MSLQRWVEEKLVKTLQERPAVALLGPRQVGKTTLAQSILQKKEPLYVDLESPKDLVQLDDAIAFFSFHRERLIILDEIQRAPDLFMTLRGVIDQNRQAGRKTEQFLLLGSASMDLLRQSSESLAGRISYIEMGGLHLLEIDGENQADIRKLWLRGGFPESYLADDDGMAMRWLEDLIRTYLERDIPQMGFTIPAPRLRRLWTMLAHLQGETLNYSTLATNLEVDGKTITHYLDILVDLLLVRRLEPWHANVKKRLVKSPRYYIRDSGITHRLLGLADFTALMAHPVLGKSWEGFAIENIISVLPFGANAYFYRTAAGAEIDLVIEMPDHKRWAIEIKYGSIPKITRGFHTACNDIGAARKYVVHRGGETFPMRDDVMAVPLLKLMQELSQL